MSSNINPIEDTYLSDVSPTTNYSSSDRLYLVSAAPGAVYNVLMRFDASSVIALTNITEVTLHCTVEESHVQIPGTDILIYAGLVPYNKRNITDSTWNKWNGVDDWATAGGDVDDGLGLVTISTISAEDQTTLSGDVTSLYEYARDTLDVTDWFTIVIKTGCILGSTYTYLYSSEYATASYRPYLTFTYSSASTTQSEPAVTISQSFATSSTVSAERSQVTSIIVPSVSNHTDTQYQIFDYVVSTNDTPLIDVRSSNTELLTNGNISELSLIELGIILKMNHLYKIRFRTKSGSSWSSWSSLTTFRTRDLDYKYKRGHRNSEVVQLTTETATNRGATIVNNGSAVTNTSTSRGATIVNPD